MKRKRKWKIQSPYISAFMRDNDQVSRYPFPPRVDFFFLSKLKNIIWNNKTRMKTNYIIYINHSKIDCTEGGNHINNKCKWNTLKHWEKQWVKMRS